MSISNLEELAEELSTYARSFDGVTRETIIKPIAKGGRRKAGDDGPRESKGLSVSIVQTVSGIKMETGDTFKGSSLVTPEDALRIGHQRLDRALKGLVNGAA